MRVEQPERTGIAGADWSGRSNEMKAIHGGDIYRNQVTLDFSVNVNPLGIPGEVEAALHDAVKECGKYPDISAEKLSRAVSDMLQIPKEYLLFGNGASELFMAIMHGIRPKKTVIPVPSFYGYEYAAEAASENVWYYIMKEEAQFCLQEDFLEALTEDTELLFLANPNNPTGSLLQKEYLYQLLNHCRDQGIYVVLDECFIEFCGEEYSMLRELERFDNLMIVRAFTKIFAIPGVRLGYLMCSNKTLRERIRRQLPEWNLSVFAQIAGCACAKQRVFIQQTVDYVREERQFLEKNLREMELQIFPGTADFILLYTKYPLYNKLLERGIMIRSCENFKGLSEGFYRIAVKSREENERLIQILKKLL